MYSGGEADKLLMSNDGSRGSLADVEADFVYTSAIGGPLGISCDLTRLSAATCEQLTQWIATFKADRAFWQNSECHILCDTPSMLVLQFCDAQYKRLKVCVYMKLHSQTDLTVYPVCDPTASYRLADKVYTAQELWADGFDIAVRNKHGYCFELTQV